MEIKIPSGSGITLKLDMRYAAYFPEYAQYFGRALILLNSMYGMTNSGKLFADELTECLLEEGFIQNINKIWLKATLKDIKNIINNQTFLIEDQNEDEPVTPCMDVCKAQIQSDGSHDKLKLRIVVRGDLQNK